ncbi:hypothetical protein AMELA_G00241010 [Ameiurus melas]|uniref:Uncharacterized protein n=1 Tax=Ameiurus melas TaxID=219545 RepID=A0A7J5ZVP6_AMEME|nr:hypothetical protein AMELA_G00241010 [Ameiurus melas]
MPFFTVWKQSLLHRETTDETRKILKMAPRCDIGRRQAGGGGVMFWAMFCWECLGPGIHVACYFDTYHLPKHCCRPSTPGYTVTVFLNGSGLFQKVNAPCHTARTVQERFEEHDRDQGVDSAFKFPRSQSDRTSLGCFGNT